MIIRIDVFPHEVAYKALRIEGDTVENRDHENKNVLYGRQRWVLRTTYRRWQRVIANYQNVQEEMKAAYELDNTGMGKRKNEN